MDQKAYLAIAAMLNAFPQAAAANPDLTMATFEAALRDASSQAVIEAAQRFTCGDVPGQSKAFAPSVAEFVQEARRIAELLPYRGRAALPAPKRSFFQEPRPGERIRMNFKLSLLSAAVSNGGVDALATANERGLEDLMALGQTWGVHVPDELFDQVRQSA